MRLRSHEQPQIPVRCDHQSFKRGCRGVSVAQMTSDAPFDDSMPRLEGGSPASRPPFDLVRAADGVPRTDTDVAEGYRWVTRLSSLAQNWFLENADPLHPGLLAPR